MCEGFKDQKKMLVMFWTTIYILSAWDLQVAFKMDSFPYKVKP